jgi:hypothetical protein
MRRQTIKRSLYLGLVILLGMFSLQYSTLPPGDLTERVRAFTRDQEFNFISWVWNAMEVKLAHAAIGSERYLSEAERHALVVDYLKLVLQIQVTEGKLNEIFADPNIADPQAASAELRDELDKLHQQRSQTAPAAEAILESQISQTAAELGLTYAGQAIPPVLYHSTPLPWALIISPRDVIRQDADINLKPDFTVDQQAALEEQVDARLDVSSLVVGIGGIGVYPTMVAQTSNLNWLSEVVSHEWVHNFLTLRPLGMNYMTSPELRIMNETTASIAGKEIGRAVLEKYYPEFVPPPPPAESANQPETQPEPPAFDFNQEMHETRVAVDKMLADGQIQAAEDYMEMRRRIFWDNGYHIRKLNQAYFAFYGAYADNPKGGAAGADPVGGAVRTLRAQSPSLADFLKQISWMSSFEQLQRTVEQQKTGQIPEMQKQQGALIKSTFN